VARALIVGCGCRGRALGRRLVDAGWQARGTTRDPGNAEDILGAGLDAVVADPDQVGTVLDHVADVTLLFWLLGSAAGAPDLIAALHGHRLERLLEELVDTPVRGVVYEASGSVPRNQLEGGAAIVRAATERWRIPAEIVAADPGDWERWLETMLDAAQWLTGAGRPS
jgi:NAD(P)-dependent dehydrogenase (short-subunit alcohol dehydrogenase family)